jgi:hypothetical protein
MGVRWTLCGFGKKGLEGEEEEELGKEGDILYCVLIGSLG